MNIQEVVYCDYRNKIKSGDLLAWDKGRKGFIAGLLMKIVKLATGSKYCHVGIAWKSGGRLFVIEATPPAVRLTPLSVIKSFYHIPMKIRWLSKYNDYLLDKIGLKYSIKDCIRAYFGKLSPDNDEYQCAELACEFYKSIGIDLGESYEPGILVKAVILKRNTNIVLVCK